MLERGELIGHFLLRCHGLRLALALRTCLALAALATLLARCRGRVIGGRRRVSGPHGKGRTEGINLAWRRLTARDRFAPILSRFLALLCRDLRDLARFQPMPLLLLRQRFGDVTIVVLHELKKLLLRE